MKFTRIGLASGLSILGIATALASPSNATPVPTDPSGAFGEENYAVICNLIGQEPTPHGIWGANSYLLTEQPVSLNLNYRQMQLAIAWAIAWHCPEYTAIYSAYRSRYP